LPSLLLYGHSSYEIIPLIEIWFQSEGFETCILANKVEAKKKIGILSSLNVSVFLEDSPNVCLTRINGDPEITSKFVQYLNSLPLPPPRLNNEANGTVIREKEIVKIPCRYCGALIIITENRCFNCGAVLKV
jgi:hypothetical protein